jgi:Holliday junction resolvase
MSKFSRAPKQIGDFGEDFVAYVLIRKGYEVAVVDHIGADLIAQRGKERIAVSVKTRMYKKKSGETRGFPITKDHIEKLKDFSERFGLKPVIAHLVSIVDDQKIHLFMFRAKDRNKFDKVKLGFRLRYGKKHLNKTTQLPHLDYSVWSGETIGEKL